MRIRKGIQFKNGICKCDKHSKQWIEGDEFEEYGGAACKECILKASIEDIEDKKTASQSSIVECKT